MPQASPQSTPVLIVGCGPVGLTMSLLMSRQGIRHILIEKRERVSTLPRARGITARTVEIWNQLDLGARIESISLPPKWVEYFVYTTTVAGEVFGKMPTEAMQPGALAALSPFDYKVAAQDQIDPMLFDAARTHDEADIRFNTELIGYREEADCVVATLRDANGESYEVTARYLVGADGGSSTVRRLAGIVEGKRLTFASFVNNHLKADLSRFTEGREGALIWTLAPGLEGLFQMLDGKSAWAVHIQYDPASEDGEWNQERALKAIRAMIGDPAADEVNFDILRTYTYTITSMLPERIRAGRVLLIGDAAHQIPPYGGFGMNTGIQTAHNLAWKLAALMRGEGGDGLLDSFDSERREVARRVTEFGRINAGYIEQLKGAIRTASTAAERNRLIDATKQYGNWNGLDLGVHYENGAFVPDDVAAPHVDNPVIDFIPHAKPGYRAPHIWVTRAGERISTVLLFDRFTLLAGPEGDAWVDAARKCANPSIAAYRVAGDGDLIPEGDFCSLYGIGASGAVLVRPDGHVGLRVPAVTANPEATLREALDTILSRAN